MGLFKFRATDGVAETTPSAPPKKIALATVSAAITGKDGVLFCRLDIQRGRNLRYGFARRRE
jgi:hypothetical protein